MPPAGRFVLPEATRPRHVVAFAPAAGITPIASQMRTVLVREPKSRVFLFYGNRTSRSILFREAIEDLKDRYVDRFSVHNVLSREAQDVHALNGRIDGEKVAAFMRHVVPIAAVDVFLLAGRAPFLNGCVEGLKALGAADDKMPSNGSRAPKGRPPVEARAAATQADRTAVAVTLDGVTTTLRLAPGERIVDAALAAGVHVPYSCKGGMCCTCRAKLVRARSTCDQLLAGAVGGGAGFVLTCQAVPIDAVVLDYDQM